jgi:adenosylcobinamide kinase / adenosylcobinamide-phosphate guanylyltransferase
MLEGGKFGRSELILGGQKSGKSRRAEMLASRWLALHSHHRAVLIATARAGDDEMRQRIARHQSDRALRVPALQTVEEPRELAQAIVQHADQATLVVVDCLTLWLANLIAPLPAETDEKGALHQSNAVYAHIIRAEAAIYLIADIVTSNPAGALVFVSNEIGLGVIPMGSVTRGFVDTLGLLNQRLAACCDRVTLMAAGLPLQLKDSA